MSFTVAETKRLQILSPGGHQVERSFVADEIHGWLHANLISDSRVRWPLAGVRLVSVAGATVHCMVKALLRLRLKAAKP